MAQIHVQKNAVDVLRHKLDGTHIAQQQAVQKSGASDDVAEDQGREDLSGDDTSSVFTKDCGSSFSSSADAASTDGEPQEDRRVEEDEDDDDEEKGEDASASVVVTGAVNAYGSPDLGVAVYEASEYIPLHAGANQIADYNYLVQPVYDQSTGMTFHGYVPYTFSGVQNAMGDCGFVSQPYPDSVAVGLQFQPQGNVAYAYGPPQMVQYTGFQHAAPQACQYSPYNEPMHAPGLLMLDSQDPVQPAGVLVSNGVQNIGSFAAPLPVSAFPHSGMMMMDPAQQGMIVSNECNAVPVPTSTLGLPARLTPELPSVAPQAVVVSDGLSNMNVTTGLTVGFPVTAVPSSDKESFPGSQSYSPVYHDLHTTTPFPGWERSVGPVGFPVTFLQPPTIAVPGYKCSANNCSSAKSRAPLIDVTRNYNKSSSGGFSFHKVDLRFNGVADFKNRQISKQRTEGNWSTGGYQRTRVEWAPISKNVDGAQQKPKSPLSHDISDEHRLQGRYNRTDFVTEYDDAKHFIIKSFSDANVRQSVKYEVWASTSHGNRKLDQAYQEAQSMARGKPNGCPVFLFFSVNGSGHFCGVAEMVGRVDYSKTLDCWDRERWSGSFPVKWHIIKNVPNSQLHGIILQNNESKPVTSSRDTQEVSLQQGLEMLKIFKNSFARSWILDDCDIANQDYNSTSQDSPERPQMVNRDTEKSDVPQKEERENVVSISA